MRLLHLPLHAEPAFLSRLRGLGRSAPATAAAPAALPGTLQCALPRQQPEPCSLRHATSTALFARLLLTSACARAAPAAMVSFWLVESGIMRLLPALLGTPWRSVQLATLWLCQNLQHQCASLGGASWHNTPRCASCSAPGQAVLHAGLLHAGGCQPLRKCWAVMSQLHCFTDGAGLLTDPGEQVQHTRAPSVPGCPGLQASAGRLHPQLPWTAHRGAPPRLAAWACKQPAGRALAQVVLQQACVDDSAACRR